MVGGRYRIRRTLHADRGFGGCSFGPIYEATDTADGLADVAVREFTRADPDFFRLGLPLFHAAYDKLRILQVSPLIPTVIAFLEAETAAYIITEYLPGPSLHELLSSRADAGFRMEAVIEWGKSLCDLLDLMHSQRPPLLLNRNFGPLNLLLDSFGKAKLVDLGLARDRILYWKPLRYRVY
jgi:serine/threonine protein kinase